MAVAAAARSPEVFLPLPTRFFGCPAVSAKLLEAKQVVEDDLDDPGAAGLADHLAALTAAAADAAVAADGGDTRPAACTAP